MLVFSLPILAVINTTLPQYSVDCKTYHTHGLTYPASLLLDQESFPSEAVYLRKADSGINSLVHRSKTLCCFLHFGCGKA